MPRHIALRPEAYDRVGLISSSIVFGRPIGRLSMGLVGYLSERTCDIKSGEILSSQTLRTSGRHSGRADERSFLTLPYAAGSRARIRMFSNDEFSLHTNRLLNGAPHAKCHGLLAPLRVILE